MKKPYISAFIFMMVVLITAFSARYLWSHVFNNNAPDDIGVDLHTYIHDQLQIDEGRIGQLEEIETRYGEQKQALEQSIRQLNAELADAMLATDTYTEEVQEIINKIHVAMGELQQVTVEHLFELQGILEEEQKERFRQMVTNALYQNAQQEN